MDIVIVIVDVVAIIIIIIVVVILLLMMSSAAAAAAAAAAAFSYVDLNEEELHQQPFSIAGTISTSTRSGIVVAFVEAG